MPPNIEMSFHLFTEITNALEATAAVPGRVMSRVEAAADILDADSVGSRDRRRDHV